MKIISPSILSADYLELKKDIEAFKECSNIWFHLDIMDGHFVPNITFGPVILKNIHKITNHKLDAHLMVTNPEEYIEWLKPTNIYNFTYHYEVFENESNHFSLIDKIKKNYQSVGISLKPKTQPEVLSIELLKKLDLVLIMTVEPGFGGQNFMPDCAEKIKFFAEIKKTHNLNFQIQVDGGINETTAKTCFDYGANNLVAGSFIFKNNLNEYKSIINKLQN